jgi:glycosyltransferase involved in cell wall biosynthesis
VAKLVARVYRRTGNGGSRAPAAAVPSPPSAPAPASGTPAPPLASALGPPAATAAGDRRSFARKLVTFPVVAAWSLLYVGVMHATNWQLEWLLNVRERWLGWGRIAGDAAGRADVYHGHDLSALAAAVHARRRFGGRVVYDSHEVYLESGQIAARPRWARAILARLERRWYRGADGFVAVNRPIAAELERRYGRKRRVAVVHNCPPRWTPPTPPPRLLRDAAGIPDGVPVLLYHGAFAAVRGLEQMAEAILEPGLQHVHLCYLGYGRFKDRLEEMASELRFGSRLHVLPAVPTDQLDLWVASADVGMMPNQPETLNQLVSTPNKLFESIAAGVPVVTSDFPERRRIVMTDPAGPLGAVCDPTDPASIAGAVRSLVELDAATRADLRARCIRAAHERWNWEQESARLLALYASLLELPKGTAGAVVQPGTRDAGA